MKRIDFNRRRYGNYTLGTGDRERIRIIIDLIGQNKDVLDVGCGQGEIGRLIKKNHNRVWGVDIAVEAVKKARRYFPAKTCDIEEENIPFNEKFDAIVAGEIIEHVFDTDAFLKKLTKKLKRGGFLIITTPNLATLGRRLLLLIGKNPLTETRVVSNSAGHLRYFTKSTLFQLIEERLTIDTFTSDLVNFTSSGRFNNRWLAKIMPTLGKTLIIKASKP